MTSIVQESRGSHCPEGLVETLRTEPGVILLQSASSGGVQGRYSFVAARPFLTFQSDGARCQTHSGSNGLRVQFGNPWQVLEQLMARYELLDQVDLPFPLGGCLGFWGYPLKNFVELGLPQRAHCDLPLPDCQVGFYGSLVAFDHLLGRTWIIATGLAADGSRQEKIAHQHLDFWRRRLESDAAVAMVQSRDHAPCHRPSLSANLTRAQFIDRVQLAQRYIARGDIYQVNLSQRFAATLELDSWDLYRRLLEVSPAPFAAYVDGGEFQIASSSPELFLRMSGARVVTRPIKGTRPRSADPTEDTQLAYELQTSSKELAELVMITDLLRNDLGRVCEYGSVHVPELVRLERYAHVQHLVSTVEGRLRPDCSHLGALAACFPGGSITGAPKIRAMQIIEELEPVTRGPYTGVLGYLGFNRESQLSIIIRAAICHDARAYFHAGAGIVADSVAEAEYDETLAKARGYFDALNLEGVGCHPLPTPAREERRG